MVWPHKIWLTVYEITWYPAVFGVLKLEICDIFEFWDKHSSLSSSNSKLRSGSSPPVLKTERHPGVPNGKCCTCKRWNYIDWLIDFIRYMNIIYNMYIILLNYQSYQCQCSCWPLKSSEHFPNVTTCTITMTISHSFHYKFVLKMFKISDHLAKTKQNRQWPMAWREQEHSYHI